MAGFADTINEFVLQFDEGVENTMRATAIATFTGVIKGSPVDEGTFRGAWVASDGNVASGASSHSSESAVTSAMTNKILGLPKWDEFTFTNNLPYALVIEYGLYGDGPKTVGGYSKQAPAGVVRVNIAQSQRLLEQEARRRLPR